MTPNPSEIGSYVLNGKEVSFWIQVSLSSVTNFGSQSYINLYLPSGFPAASNYFFTTAYLLHGGQQYQLDGIATSGGTAISMWWKGSQLYVQNFTYNSPVVLVKADFISISGTYLTP